MPARPPPVIQDRLAALPFRTGSSLVPLSEYAVMTSLSAVRRDSTRPVPGSTMTSSVVTAPLTTDSPSPQAALITIWSRRPLDGLAVNMTPAASESTIRWTTTARRTWRGDALTGPVGHGACGPQRRPAVEDRRRDTPPAPDVQVGVLLPREAGRGKVLGSGRGADRHRRIRNATVPRGCGLPGERAVGLAQLPGDVLRQHASGEQRADALRGGVVAGSLCTGRKRGKFENPRCEAVGPDEVQRVGCGGQHEAGRNGKSCLRKLSEVGALSAGRADVAAPHLVKVLDVGHDRASLLPGPASSADQLRSTPGSQRCAWLIPFEQADRTVLWPAVTRQMRLAGLFRGHLLRAVR